MSNKLYATSGTLAPGVPTVADIQVSAGGFTPGYVEVHNHSSSVAMTVSLPSGIGGIGAQSFYVPPGSKVQIPGPVASLSILSAGAVAYSIYGGESKEQLPSLASILQGNVTSSVSPMDGVTLEDTGAVCQVKAAGITSNEIAPASVGTIALVTGSVTYPKLGVGSIGDPGDTPALLFSDIGIGPGTTLTLTYGGAPVTYEFNFVDPVNANVHVDLATMPTSLATAIMANQAPLVAFAGGNNTWIGAPDNSNVQAGATLTGVSTAGTVVVVKAAAASVYSGVEHYRITLAALTAANGFAVFSPGTIYGYNITCTRAAGTLFDPTGTSVLITGGNKALYVSTFGAGGVAGDFVDVTLFVNY